MLYFIIMLPSPSPAWNDETHLAIAKAAGYYKWYNATGADIVKIKAHKIEGPNHFRNNPHGTVITRDMVLAQSDKYNKPDKDGHLYGALISSLGDYIKYKKEGKYGEYNFAYFIHYVGDLSQPLHNILYSPFNRKYHIDFDGILNNEALENLHKIPIKTITINSERDIATEIARIANLSIALGYKLEKANRMITKEEAYIQIGYSASLIKATLEYVGK